MGISITRSGFDKQQENAEVNFLRKLRY